MDYKHHEHIKPLNLNINRSYTKLMDQSPHHGSPRRKISLPALSSNPRPQDRRALGTPAEVTSLDHRIARHGGTSSGLEILRHRVEKAKRDPQPDYSKRIEELVRENGYLRQEISYFKETRQGLLDLHATTIDIYQQLERALQTLSEKVAMSERDMLEYWGIKPSELEGDEVKLF
ncbi:MAG: hypothetical protein M1834_000923 [Cirrosporium novae-zelandiae]|nr:MAG: hypothetical protein M1834_000923 [Cirrosporium novae-zelandiae]